MAPLSETGISRRTFIQTSLAGTALVALPTPLRAKLPASARDIARLDATAQAALVRAGDVTAFDLAEAAIARIEALNPALNAIASKGFEAGRALARSGPPAGVFSGVPFLIKDLIEFPPLPHMAGSRLMASNVGSFASPYGARVKEAGLVVLGTTTTPEFGLLPTTEPLLTGATRNPWDTDRIAGGSSGGAAAAVASGMVPIAHASDGGGSIRFPAACCGVFGLKPSRGRNVEARREPSPIGVENCFSRSVRDSAAFLHQTQQRGPDAPLTPLPLITAPGTRKLRIGVTVASYTGSLPDTDTADAVMATAELCRAMGHEVEEVAWPFDCPAFVDHFLTLWGLGAAAIAARARAALGPDADLSTVLEPWTLGLAAEYGPRGEAGAAAAFENFRHVAEAMAARIAELALTGSAKTRDASNHSGIYSRMIGNVLSSAPIVKKRGFKNTYVRAAMSPAAMTASISPCRTTRRISSVFFSPIKRAQTEDRAILMPKTMWLMSIVIGKVKLIPARMVVSPSRAIKYVSASCTEITANSPQIIGIVIRIRWP